ncbi:hypothetical protein KP509_1Z090500 [Ceratopteris richardii]|nr:hypothetical protein KP509_1Z090500 [Ceratopteris richardii]KAH6557839.1 hypothetical protein KP509_1Z090500 [Ceratopteris richardii]
MCFKWDLFNLFASNTPSSRSCISVTTFNILAPIYNRSGSDKVQRESQNHDAWFTRNSNILDLLISKGSIIICLQEFWLANEEFVHLYKDSLGRQGYQIFTLLRSSDKGNGGGRGDGTGKGGGGGEGDGGKGDGGKGDGLLTAIKSERISVLGCEDVYFNDLKGRVAQILHLRSPIYEKNGIAHVEFLLVNTHLEYPHNSRHLLIRVWQAYKILDCLEQFKLQHHCSESVPVVLCGDWNGGKSDIVYKFLRSQGFVSSYDVVNGYKDSDVNKWVSHKDHLGNVQGVDFIWLRDPRVHHEPLRLSWRKAAIHIIMKMMHEAGVSGEQILSSTQSRDKTSLFDLLRELYQLSGKIVGNYITQEIEGLMQNEYVDTEDLIDYSVQKTHIAPLDWARSFILSSIGSYRMLTLFVKPFPFVVKDASLFPPRVEQGVWPEDYALSDHACLSVTFNLRKLS